MARLMRDSSLGCTELLPLPAENPYPGQEYGFSAGRVRVALGFPRVTHDNHYLV